jgi:hypothetical protein
MIVRKYGNTVQSVEPNFDSRAMTEIGFTRTSDFQVPAEEFDGGYERQTLHELTAQADGDVQGEAEDALLASLREQLRELAESTDDERVLFIENRPGADPPKTRCTQTTRVVQGTNRLYFEYVVEPPLRVGVYRRRG